MISSRYCNEILRRDSFCWLRSSISFYEYSRRLNGSNGRGFKYQIIISAQQYFQQKFNMATPNNFVNRYSQFPYHLALNPWAMGNPTPYNLHPHLAYNPFPQQFNYSYLLPPHGFYPPALASPAVPASGPAPPSGPGVVGVRAEERSIGVNNKFQKSQKKGQEGTVIQISDDQQPAQQGKVCQEKSTSSNNKLNTNDSLINTRTPQLIQKQQKPHPKKQQRPPELLASSRPPKTKEICKINNLKKKCKNETVNKESQQKKGQVFSQRIIEKKDAKKQPYRLSKRDRQLLEISFLRDVDNEVLTGPQFQAKLPPFLAWPDQTVPRALDLQNWKRQLKANLLERMEINQE